MPGPLIDITDQRFGSLTVLYREPGRDHGSTLWMCLCDCGNYKSTSRRRLEVGDNVSCGMHSNGYSPSFYRQAQELWCAGKGQSRIAQAMGVTVNVVAGVVWRNPHLFPPRESARGT